MQRVSSLDVFGPPSGRLCPPRLLRVVSSLSSGLFASDSQGDEPQSDDVARVCLVVGRKSTLRQRAMQVADVVEPALGNGHESLADTVVMLSELPSGVPRSTYILSKFGPILLSVGVIPDTYSRHNSPSRPDSVFTLCSDAIPSSASGMMGIIVLSDSDEFNRSYASAVARAFPSYSAQTQGDEKKSKGVDRVEVVFPGSSVDPIPLESLMVNVRFAAHLVDMPCSELHTDAFVDVVQSIVSNIPEVSIEIIRGKELDERGYGGMWGVGKASEHLPALVVLQYRPLTASRNYVLVGKGIVYDTGGLSIKDKFGMPGMKRDMGGAAAVLGAFLYEVDMGFSENLACILCLAENSVSTVATRPDDILYMYSGLTVEVNNTDAEGRLVLADGIAHACRWLQPDVIVDCATLTGAQSIATGTKHAAIVSNDDDIESCMVLSGKDSGDLCHPLVYCPEFFFKEFKSSVADMKNSQKDRTNAGSSCPAQFVAAHMKEFLENGGKWCHVDMAAPVHEGERATGFGVGLLSRFLRRSLQISVTKE